MKEGCISFQIYAYPPNLDDLHKDDGGAAIKRRVTMKKMQRGEYDIDEETEARILGLQKDEKAVVVGKSSNG